MGIDKWQQTEFPENSMTQEKKFFLRKLKTNPYFLVTHLPSLSKIIYQRYRSKYMTWKFPSHQGMKTRPSWLKHFPIQIKKNHPTIPIPVRQLKTKNNLCIAIDQAWIENNDVLTTELQISLTNDIEDYLATHRWAILIQNIITQQFDLPQNISGWIKNPPPKSNAAWETYSCCERIANFITFVSFVPLDQRKRFLMKKHIDFIRDSMEWIYTHLEYYQEQTGNHILNNARALIMASSFLQNKDMMNVGLCIFKHMLPQLVQADGALREGSTHYQLIVLTWLLDAYTFAQCSGLVQEDSFRFLKPVIYKMKKVAQLFCNAQGELLDCIGDISPDAPPYLTSQHLLICYPNHWPAFSSSVQSLSIECSFHKRDDWYLLESRHNRVLLRCPSGKYPSHFLSHAHNDLTSFIWTFQKIPILIDSGRSRYTKNHLSALQKSAMGHNVPLINHLPPVCESLVINGNWHPVPYANAQIKVSAVFVNQIHITHNGFRRATPVRQHTRKITVNKSSLLVDDLFLGRGIVELNLFWHFHDVWQETSQSFVLRCQNWLLYIESPSLYQGETKWINTHESLGWHAASYGEARRHSVLFMRLQIQLPFTSQIQFKVKKCVA